MIGHDNEIKCFDEMVCNDHINIILIVKNTDITECKSLYVLKNIILYNVEYRLKIKLM